MNMADLIVKSKIKEVAGDCNVAGDVAGALDKMAEELVKAAAKRADANGRRTVQAKDAFVGKHNAKTMLVVRSKVKDVVKGHNVSGDFAEALNEMIVWSVMQGCERAKANGRRTLQARDL
jgi:histone H3/H4